MKGEEGLIRIAVNGACGRMGQLVCSLILRETRCRLVAAIDSPNHPAVGTEVGVLAGSGVTVCSSLDTEADVLIDFSSPSGTMVRMEECLQRGCNMVVGTTGLGENEISRLRQSSSRIACLVAPNMSVGMNVLFRRVGELLRDLGEGYDVEIVEMHHRHKKDAPSGTALRLAEAITDAVGAKRFVHGREGMTGPRSNDEMGILAVRAGDIAGVHTVICAGHGETIEITHRAHSREPFAAGALRAAIFLAGKENGWYTMEDVLAGEQE